MSEHLQGYIPDLMYFEFFLVIFCIGIRSTILDANAAELTVEIALAR